MTFSAVLHRSTAGCPTDLLRFDLDNPRLEDGRERSLKSDVQMIKSLKDVAALGELIQSICANTYRDIEPMIVMGPDHGPFTVLEGNRRLACIKLIKDSKLAAECGITIPAHGQEVVDSLQTVTVYRVNDHEEARAFIGFKHINGPHRWESYAKAKFVTDWFQNERDHGITIDIIAERLGDDNSTIRSMIAGMLVLQQAQAGGFDVSDRFNKGRFAFSHLYTALQRPDYTEFLGLKRGWANAPTDNPVPGDHAISLSEVMLWLYGSKSHDTPPIIKSQNPDLARLGEAMKNPVAMQVIRAGKSLSEAIVELRPVAAVLGEVLVEVNSRLREGVQLASRAENIDKSILTVGRQIKKQGESLVILLNNNVKDDAVVVADSEDDA